MKKQEYMSQADKLIAKSKTIRYGSLEAKYLVAAIDKLLVKGRKWAHL